MKRVRSRSLVYLFAPALLIASAFGLFGDCPGPDADVILSWIAVVRRDAGCGPVAADPLLERAALEYAAELAERGVLSHRDPAGRDVLDRVQAGGGTSTLVGEILGSSTGPQAASSAWGASQAHRAVVENPLWTHAGVGCASAGARQVWVVLFAARRISGLRIESPPAGESGGRVRVSGRLPRGRTLTPVLLSGLLPLEPELWLPQTGRFVYLVPPGAEATYHRLGFQDAEGWVTITDAFYPVAVATSSP